MARKTTGGSSLSLLKSFPLAITGLMIVSLGIVSCRSGSPDATALDEAAISGDAPVEGTGTAETIPLPTETTATEVAATTDSAYRATPINPPRTAHLTAAQADSQINLRSQPTTQSASRGYGLPGDQIQLQQLAEGEGGFSWYYVKFAKSGAEGWVRGDFIDTAGQATAAAPSTPDAKPKTTCGEVPQEAYFETKSFTIYICKTAAGLSYIGTNKTTKETLRTDDVRNSQGTYIAINGNYQYHVNDSSLAVYRVDNGEYTQLQGESVIQKTRSN